MEKTLEHVDDSDIARQPRDLVVGSFWDVYAEEGPNFGTRIHKNSVEIHRQKAMRSDFDTEDLHTKGTKETMKMKIFEKVYAHMGNEVQFITSWYYIALGQKNIIYMSLVTQLEFGSQVGCQIPPNQLKNAIVVKTAKPGGTERPTGGFWDDSCCWKTSNWNQEAKSTAALLHSLDIYSLVERYTKRYSLFSLQLSEQKLNLKTGRERNRCWSASGFIQWPWSSSRFWPSGSLASSVQRHNLRGSEWPKLKGRSACWSFFSLSWRHGFQLAFSWRQQLPGRRDRVGAHREWSSLSAEGGEAQCYGHRPPRRDPQVSPMELETTLGFSG